jgi:hypothetical protein
MQKYYLVVTWQQQLFYIGIPEHLGSYYWLANTISLEQPQPEVFTVVVHNLAKEIVAYAKKVYPGLDFLELTETIPDESLVSATVRVDLTSVTDVGIEILAPAEQLNGLLAKLEAYRLQLPSLYTELPAFTVHDYRTNQFAIKVSDELVKCGAASNYIKLTLRIDNQSEVVYLQKHGLIGFYNLYYADLLPMVGEEFLYEAVCCILNLNLGRLKSQLIEVQGWEHCVTPVNYYRQIEFAHKDFSAIVLINPKHSPLFDVMANFAVSKTQLETIVEADKLLQFSVVGEEFALDLGEINQLKVGDVLLGHTKATEASYLIDLGDSQLSAKLVDGDLVITGKVS